MLYMISQFVCARKIIRMPKSWSKSIHGKNTAVALRNTSFYKPLKRSYSPISAVSIMDLVLQLYTYTTIIDWLPVVTGTDICHHLHISDDLLRVDFKRI